MVIHFWKGGPGQSAFRCCTKQVEWSSSTDAEKRNKVDMQWYFEPFRGKYFMCESLWCKTILPPSERVKIYLAPLPLAIGPKNLTPLVSGKKYPPSPGHKFLTPPLYSIYSLGLQEFAGEFARPRPIRDRGLFIIFSCLRRVAKKCPLKISRPSLGLPEFGRQRSGTVHYL